jgi:hypothetical protein
VNCPFCRSTIVEIIAEDEDLRTYECFECSGVFDVQATEVSP